MKYLMCNPVKQASLGVQSTVHAVQVIKYDLHLGTKTCNRYTIYNLNVASWIILIGREVLTYLQLLFCK